MSERPRIIARYIGGSGVTPDDVHAEILRHQHERWLGDVTVTGRWDDIAEIVEVAIDYPMSRESAEVEDVLERLRLNVPGIVWGAVPTRKAA